MPKSTGPALGLTSTVGWGIGIFAVWLMTAYLARSIGTTGLLGATAWLPAGVAFSAWLVTHGLSALPSRSCVDGLISSSLNAGVLPLSAPTPENSTTEK
ncbi:hypothetical protein PPN31114_03962 [Pandoraea pneumonica]|uniref:Uncharacterized protein n=1 Tax=Pandoraea pneumonica TaxID=2508299 RepID=A0A5E4XLA6_9BURK|nr:hypothetical protein PPN31114_03962 [Pandoraea pneumonica]